ncbi:MotE family protein [Alkalibacillus silvisoli]|uniref:Magnesium transporter MgtE intracellular domain-containing protein n=1 Tax=Alkalibacillus silvisoli TaxID=392823 RepID=A0ABP3JQF7_9BACI
MKLLFSNIQELDKGDEMTKEQINKEGTSKWQWFLYVIIIPIVFAITLVLIVTTIAGVNPFQAAQEYGNKIPVVSSLIPDPEEERFEEELSEYEATVNDQQATIQDLESRITSRDQEIEELTDEINSLHEELNQQEESRYSQEESVERLTRSFSEMSPERAADIMIEMEQVIALDILEALSDDQRGEILSEMESEIAANFSNSLIERTSN